MNFEEFTENEKKLFEKYPGFFRQAELDATQTCMCWGLECPYIWFPIIEEAVDRIAQVVDDGDIEFAQIKEKFYTLRIYYDVVNDDVTSDQIKQIDNIIDEAEIKVDALENKKPR